MNTDEIVLILVLLLVVIPLGIILIRFSAIIGRWFYDFKFELYKGFAASNTDSRSESRGTHVSWAILGLGWGRTFHVWLIRFAGIAVIGMSIFALVMVIF
jgi:hypothetical protein